jgi:preprotein translocase subunit YajC
MLISPAYAQSGVGAGFDIMALAPLVLIFVVFYFLLIRPQQKKMKQHKDMLSAVRRGDRVVVGGIIGTVAKVSSDAELSIEIADGVRVRVVRGAITEVLSKTEPVKAEGGDKPTVDKPASGS